MPAATTNGSHSTPFTFTVASTTVGATKKRRSEAERNKTPSRQVLSHHHTAISSSSSSPSSLFLSLGCDEKEEGIVEVHTNSINTQKKNTVSPTTLLKQVGKDFAASRQSAASRRTATTTTATPNKTPIRTRFGTPPRAPTKHAPQSSTSTTSTGRSFAGGKRRHSDAVMTSPEVVGNLSLSPSVPSPSYTVRPRSGCSGGYEQEADDEDEEGDLRQMWERELSIGSGAKQQVESQQHYRNLLYAPRKSASSAHHPSEDSSMCHLDSCSEVTDLCRGSTPTTRYQSKAALSVSPISLFGAGSPSPPPPPFACCPTSTSSTTAFYPPTTESLSYYRRQSPFHRFAAPTSFPPMATINGGGRASSITSNATSIATVCAKPIATTTSTTASVMARAKSSSTRVYSPQPVTSGGCTTPPRGPSRFAETDPPTSTVYVDAIANSFEEEEDNTVASRGGAARKPVARRRLNVALVAESDAEEGGYNAEIKTNRSLEFASYNNTNYNNNFTNYNPTPAAVQSSFDDDLVDPTLMKAVSLTPPPGVQSRFISSGGGGFAEPSTPLQQSQRKTTRSTPSPPAQQQNSVLWKEQANEWTSRTQAFFDELDQRPLHELQH